MEDVRERVSEFYGETVSKTEDLIYTACCTLDYKANQIDHVTQEVLDKRYGCESPIPEVLEGRTLLDLGSGAGPDCFIAAKYVGETGKVIGVDMTPAQLEIANRNIEPIMKKLGFSKPNVEFLEGHIEDIPVDDASVDVVISNCVINLSYEKEKIFQEIWRILKPGGSFFFSDIVADRRIPDTFDKDPRLHSECYTGAAYTGDLWRIMKGAGFNDVRIVSQRKIEEVIDEVHFESLIIRGFKIALEDSCEDYGQEAVYKGTIEDNPEKFKLDRNHVFNTGESVKVCKNTADIIRQSRFSPHFSVTDEGLHAGPFNCEPCCVPESDGPASTGCC